MCEEIQIFLHFLSVLIMASTVLTIEIFQEKNPRGSKKLRLKPLTYLGG